MNRAIQTIKHLEPKPYINRNQHSDHTLLDKDKSKHSFFCWHCRGKLVERRLWDGSFGLYCPRCTRFRKMKVPVETGVGVCPKRRTWSRVDVRRCGKYGKKVLLDEVL